MITNYDVDAFLTSLRDEGEEVQNFIKHFLLLLDDAHNPEMAPVRARLRALMQRDLEIGKHRQVWAYLALWLEEPAQASKPSKSTGKVIEGLGVTPP